MTIPLPVRRDDTDLLTHAAPFLIGAAVRAAWEETTVATPNGSFLAPSYDDHLPPHALDRRGRVDPVVVATWHHLSTDDQTALQTAVYLAMRGVFLARWAELGLSRTSPPPTALARLMTDARATAQSVGRNHNAAITALVARYIAWFRANHLDKGWSESSLLIALNAALADYLVPRIQRGAKGLASLSTGIAHSLADLYAGGSDARYRVVGPPLTPASCAVCRAYYGRTLTQAQAWSLMFPAHPNCDHTLELMAS